MDAHAGSSPDPELVLERLPYLAGVEADLVRAVRRQDPGDRRSGTSRLLVGAVAASVVLVALVAGWFDSAGLRPAAALRFTSTEDAITIDIVDADASPEQVEAELRAKGIAAAIVRASAPPSLDGRLVAVGFADDVEGIDVDGDQVVDRIVLSAGFAGMLELVIADADADPSSAWGASGPPRDCELLIDRPVGEVGDSLVEVSTSIVWSRWIIEDDQHDHHRVDGRSDVPDSDTVVELFIDATGELQVTTTPTPAEVRFPFPESRCR